jgi:hypothetical protein
LRQTNEEMRAKIKGHTEASVYSLISKKTTRDKGKNTVRASKFWHLFIT